MNLIKNKKSFIAVLSGLGLFLSAGMPSFAYAAELNQEAEQTLELIGDEDKTKQKDTAADGDKNTASNGANGASGDDDSSKTTSTEKPTTDKSSTGEDKAADDTKAAGDKNAGKSSGDAEGKTSSTVEDPAGDKSGSSNKTAAGEDKQEEQKEETQGTNEENTLAVAEENADEEANDLAVMRAGVRSDGGTIEDYKGDGSYTYNGVHYKVVDYQSMIKVRFSFSLVNGSLVYESTYIGSALNRIERHIEASGEDVKTFTATKASDGSDYWNADISLWSDGIDTDRTVVFKAIDHLGEELAVITIKAFAETEYDNDSTLIMGDDWNWDSQYRFNNIIFIVDRYKHTSSFYDDGRFYLYSHNGELGAGLLNGYEENATVYRYINNNKDQEYKFFDYSDNTGSGCFIHRSIWTKGIKPGDKVKFELVNGKGETAAIILFNTKAADGYVYTPNEELINKNTSFSANGLSYSKTHYAISNEASFLLDDNGNIVFNKENGGDTVYRYVNGSLVDTYKPNKIYSSDYLLLPAQEWTKGAEAGDIITFAAYDPELDPYTGIVGFNTPGTENLHSCDISFKVQDLKGDQNAYRSYSLDVLKTGDTDNCLYVDPFRENIIFCRYFPRGTYSYELFLKNNEHEFVFPIETTWQDIKTEGSRSLKDIPAGTYNVNIEDVFAVLTIADITPKQEKKIISSIDYYYDNESGSEPELLTTDTITYKESEFPYAVEENKLVIPDPDVVNKKFNMAYRFARCETTDCYTDPNSGNVVLQANVYMADPEQHVTMHYEQIVNEEYDEDRGMYYYETVPLADPEEVVVKKKDGFSDGQIIPDSEEWKKYIKDFAGYHYDCYQSDGDMNYGETYFYYRKNEEPPVDPNDPSIDPDDPNIEPGDDPTPEDPADPSKDPVIDDKTDKDDDKDKEEIKEPPAIPDDFKNLIEEVKDQIKKPDTNTNDDKEQKENNKTNTEDEDSVLIQTNDTFNIGLVVALLLLTGAIGAGVVAYRRFNK